MKKLLGIGALTASLFIFPFSASADVYQVPTPLSIVQTMLRFGAIDINNDAVIDDYAKISDCDLFTTFRNHDFKWSKIREGLRTKIRNEQVTYPTTYVVKGLISLDRYDFRAKMFRLDPKSPLLGVNAFRLLEMIPPNFCDQPLKTLPRVYIAAIEAAINIQGFVMSEQDAQALLERMLQAGNTRQVLAKFNLQISGVPRVRLDTTNPTATYDKISYIGKDPNITMEAKLDSVEFFEDVEMKRRIHVYKP